jgi:hypothetical protein
LIHERSIQASELLIVSISSFDNGDNRPNIAFAAKSRIYTNKCDITVFSSSDTRNGVGPKSKLFPVASPRGRTVGPLQRPDPHSPGREPIFGSATHYLIQTFDNSENYANVNFWFLGKPGCEKTLWILQSQPFPPRRYLATTGNQPAASCKALKYKGSAFFLFGFTCSCLVLFCGIWAYYRLLGLTRRKQAGIDRPGCQNRRGRRSFTASASARYR